MAKVNLVRAGKGGGLGNLVRAGKFFRATPFTLA